MKTERQTEQLEALKRRIHLMAEAWRGDAARLEVDGADAYAPQVSTLHNCARDLDSLMRKAG